MLPGLIVLAPSASFSFNRDHYPRRESILLRVPRARVRVSRKCMRALGAHTQRAFLQPGHSLTRIDEHLTYLGHAYVPAYVRVRLRMSGKDTDAILRGTHSISWGVRLTNVPRYACMHVSLRSIYRYTN